MNPHLAAVLAARSTVEMFPDEDGPTIAQLVGHHAILSLTVPNVDHAMGLIEMLAPIAAAEGIILIADSYHQAVESDRPLSEEELPMHGDLERRFRDGDPTVTECLLVHTIWRGLPNGRPIFELTTCPYRRDDHGIDWLPGSNDTQDADEIAGRIPEWLTQVIDQGQVFDEPEFSTEDAEGMRMGTAAFMLSRLGVPADLIAREDDGDDTVDLREAL